MIVCQNCNAQLPDGSAVCPTCGASQGAPPQGAPYDGSQGAPQGAPPQGAYGAPQGAPPQGAYGAPQGAPPQGAYGAPQGAPPQGAYGAPQGAPPQGAYGAPQGAPPQGAYGAPQGAPHQGAYGAPQGAYGAPQGVPYGAAPQGDESDLTYMFDPRDIQDNKLMAFLDYFFILIPLIAGSYKTSPFVKFHLNQALAICLATFASGIILAIPIIGWIVGLIAIVVLGVFAIIGIVHALTGKAKKLPLVGKVVFFK